MDKPLKVVANEMVVVSKELFTDGLPLSADVYTRLPSGQFILIGKKGDTSNLANLHMMQGKSIILYIHKRAYEDLIKFNISLIEKTMHNDNVSGNVKVSLIKGVAESAVNELMDHGVHVGSYEKCKQVVSFIQETTAQINDFEKVLDIFTKIPGDMMGHSMAVSVVSLMMCEQMNITMKATVEKVVMGALLHDIGLKEVPKEILQKPRLEWAEHEVLYYEAHPLRGVEILRDLKEMPSDVLAIILEHHENALGLGYPRRIRDIKINPLARIVAVADCFVELLLEPKRDSSKRTPEECVSYMEITLGQPYNKPAFIGLKQLVNIAYLEKKRKA